MTLLSDLSGSLPSLGLLISKHSRIVSTVFCRFASACRYSTVVQVQPLLGRIRAAVLTNSRTAVAQRYSSFGPIIFTLIRPHFRSALNAASARQSAARLFGGSATLSTERAVRGLIRLPADPVSTSQPLGSFVLTGLLRRANRSRSRLSVPGSALAKAASRSAIASSFSEGLATASRLRS